MNKRLVIVEDHGLIAHTIAAAFRARGADVEVVAPETADGVAAAVLAMQPDLALVDLDLGNDLTALDVLPRLTGDGVPSVVVTGVVDPVRKAECVRAGALGVLTKEGSFEELVAAVDRVLAGEPLLTGHEREEQLALLRAHRRTEDEKLAPFRELTQREAEVLTLLMRGQSVEQIAASAVVSVSTVRSQVRAILRKLGVSSQLAAIARASDVGWRGATTPPHHHG